MNGVASIHGSQVNNDVQNKRNQAWFMPSERITTTVWIASNSPMPPQIAAIQNQLLLVAAVPNVFIQENRNPSCAETSE